jgi:hypothetical protein
MSVNTVSVSLVILPLAIEYITVYVPELSLSMSLIVLPLTLVAGTIGPDLDTTAVSNRSAPLSFVDRTIFEFIFIPCL